MSKKSNTFVSKRFNKRMSAEIRETIPEVSGKQEIERFLDQAKTLNPGGGMGRLIFALDATMSRQHTWDVACEIQAEMFEAAGKASGLAIQLVYFRGFGECRASKWVIKSDVLRSLMTGISCKGGRTQIGKVLTHARKEASKLTSGEKVSALVFVGDAMEESVDDLAHRAGELRLSGIPVFMFQEGHDAIAEMAFREVAKISGGAYMKFNQGSAAELANLLAAVARYASGGLKALSASKDRAAQGLLSQMR